MTPDEAFTEISRSRSHKAGWETIYSFLQPRLLAYVSALLVSFGHSPDESADDVVQGSLLVVLDRWKNLSGQFESISEMERYLKRVCRNHLIDRYRNKQSAAGLLNFLNLTFDQAFPGEVAIQRKVFLEQVIGQLPDECSRLLSRFVKEDITLAEMADAENTSPSTFYTKWYRCLQKARLVSSTPSL